MNNYPPVEQKAPNTIFGNPSLIAAYKIPQYSCQQRGKSRKLKFSFNNNLLDDFERTIKRLNRLVSPQYLAEPQYVEGAFGESRADYSSGTRELAPATHHENVYEFCCFIDTFHVR